MVRVALLALLLAVLAAAPAAARPRACGTVGAHHGTHAQGFAADVRASGVPCARARALARACVRGRHAGWTVSAGPGDRTRLRRAGAEVSFVLTGLGGCR